MSTMDPTGEGGGGGGGGESATTTNVEQTASPSTPIAGTTVPVVQAAVQQQQQPQQHPPPSPLSGCYLLVVLPEPHTAQHKDLILNRLAKVTEKDMSYTVRGHIMEKTPFTSLCGKDGESHA
ncbi:Microtubule-associated protein futsch [Temnothorax longispinosus]|uniref:Microtubule-associated protein futsch n=1 Tax=Temnothorax longispinosus TaxID=300112 RepID=A0A4V3SAR9_9HYME|nr:Microtubule-associated protein futsch [Temnothorax longispinosus]